MPGREIAPEIVELILRTSRVRGCKHIYSLAPRGHRIAIYFQQRRATLLAAAISNRLGRETLRTKKIAVVGGGISGLTFLLAIRHEGAEQAYLLEAGGEILTKGSAATHRLVHPNYNRWPLLGSMDAFTSLPVLNWHASSAADVVDQLRRQLRTDYNDFISDRVRAGHRVMRVNEGSPEYSSSVTVEFDTSAGTNADRYGIVVIAAGFADEKSISLGYNDYWTYDPDNYDNDSHKRPTTVYGTGDGALIDILRCCARNADDAWTTPLGTIARLRPTEALTIQKDYGREVESREKSFSDFEKSIQEHEEGLRSIAWGGAKHDADAAQEYTKMEAAFYESCIEKLLNEQKSVLDYLDGQLKPVAADPLRPILVGAYETPFEPTSAPINKLLLAYLLHTGRISYSQRDEERQLTELRAHAALSPGKRSENVVICRFGANRNYPFKPPVRRLPLPSSVTPPAQPSNGIIVTSNGGAEATTESASEAALVDALCGITGGEYVFFDAMPHPMTRARHGPDHAGVVAEDRERKKAVIKSFSRKYLGATDVNLVDGRRWVIFTPFSDDQITEALKIIGGIDGNFLGSPIMISKSLQHQGNEDF